MEYPQTKAELLERGYTYKGPGKCRSCQAPMEWWSTPRAKNIPMDPMPNEQSKAVAHWGTCPNADDFRKSKEQQTTQAAARPAQSYTPPSRPFNGPEISDDEIPF